MDNVNNLRIVRGGADFSMELNDLLRTKGANMHIGIDHHDWLEDNENEYVSFITIDVDGRHLDFIASLEDIEAFARDVVFRCERFRDNYHEKIKIALNEGRRV